MTPTQGQIIRMQGVLAVAMDNCVRPIVDQKWYIFLKKKKKKKKKELAIKIKTGVSKRKLNRSFLDSFLTTAFDGSDYELFFMNFKSDSILHIKLMGYK